MDKAGRIELTISGILQHGWLTVSESVTCTPLSQCTVGQRKKVTAVTFFRCPAVQWEALSQGHLLTILWFSSSRQQAITSNQCSQRQGVESRKITKTD